MLLQNTFFTEFLAEVNLVLAQEDYGNKFGDLLLPVKNYFQKEKNILSFSLARYCGANTQLAFFCEWYYHNAKLIRNSQPLFAENHEYLTYKIPTNLWGVKNIESTLDQQIINWYLPSQLSIIQTISKEQMLDLVAKNGYLNRYLNNKYLSRITASEIETVKSLLLEKIALSQFVELQSTRLSFLLVALPCLLGFLYNFNQEDSPINPTGVKWFLVEELLSKVAFLHQSVVSKELHLFIYRLGLSEREEFEWLEMTKADQIRTAQLDESTLEQVKNLRQKAKTEALEKLDKLIFPDKYKDILKDLIDWGFEFGGQK